MAAGALLNGCAVLETEVISTFASSSMESRLMSAWASCWASAGEPDSSRHATTPPNFRKEGPSPVRLTPPATKSSQSAGDRQGDNYCLEFRSEERRVGKECRS